jgi:hypothetical protein
MATGPAGSIHFDHPEFESDFARTILSDLFDIVDNTITEIRHRVELHHEEPSHRGVRTFRQDEAGPISELVNGFSPSMTPRAGDVDRSYPR